MKKTILVIILAVFFVMPVSAVTIEQPKEQPNVKIKVDIPPSYITLTSDSINDSKLYEKFISKTEAEERFTETSDGSKLLIDAFSKDSKSEIKVNIRKSDAISSSIVDFSILNEDEKNNILTTLLEGFNGGKFQLSVLNSSIIEKNKYAFMKITARRGTSENGYCFTNYITIIDSKYYELTIYHSASALDDKMIEADTKVFNSFQIKELNSSGLKAMDIILIIITALGILLSVLVGGFIAYSFIHDFKKRRRAPERVRLRKR